MQPCSFYSLALYCETFLKILLCGISKIGMNAKK